MQQEIQEQQQKDDDLTEWNNKAHVSKKTSLFLE